MAADNKAIANTINSIHDDLVAIKRAAGRLIAVRDHLVAIDAATKAAAWPKLADGKTLAGCDICYPDDLQHLNRIANAFEAMRDGMQVEQFNYLTMWNELIDHTDQANAWEVI